MWKNIYKKYRSAAEKKGKTRKKRALRGKKNYVHVDRLLIVYFVRKNCEFICKHSFKKIFRLFLN